MLRRHLLNGVCVCVCVWGCFVLLADSSSPPRIGPGRCRGVTMLINCLRSPVCVAACLPCHRVLGGFRVAGVRVKKGGLMKKVKKGEDNRGNLRYCKWLHAINPAVFSCACLNSSAVMLNTNHREPGPRGALCSSAVSISLLCSLLLWKGTRHEK